MEKYKFLIFCFNEIPEQQNMKEFQISDPVFVQETSFKNQYLWNYSVNILNCTMLKVKALLKLKIVIKNNKHIYKKIFLWNSTFWIQLKQIV